MARNTRKKGPIKSAPVTRVAARPAVVKPEPAAEPKPVVVASPRLKVALPEEKATKNWWQRLHEKVSPGRDEGMREQMAAVKAGVLHELETMSAQKGPRLTGQPFRNVVLPQMRRRRRWVWPLGAALALVVVVVMVMVGQRTDDPAMVIHQALVAVRKGDANGFARRVDVDAVTSSVANQIAVGGKQEGGWGPAAGEQLKAEVMDAVSHEGIPSDADNSLLVRLWQTMGGEDLNTGRVSVAMQDENMAVAEVPLEREDLALTLPLQVVLRRGEGREGWRVVDIPNFSAVMESMAQAGRATVAPAAGPSAKELLTVRDVKKSKVGDGALLLSMAVVNAGEETLNDARLRVVIGDAAGQPLKGAEVTLPGHLEPGQVREQAWTLPVDRSKAVERYAMDLPLQALTMSVIPAE